MAVAVIADAHIGGPGGSAASLLEQLRELPSTGCRHLLMLGDLFHVWVGFRKYETEDIRRIWEMLVRLRQQGMRIDYVEGNRDFFIAGGAYADAFDSVGNEVAFEIDGRRILAVHGDGVDRTDRQYLFWRRLSKNRVSRLAMRRLPTRLAERILDGTERRLAETNFAHRLEIPEEEIRGYAAIRLAEGHDLLLMGHFHEACRWRVGGGEVAICDAWFNSRRIEWLGGASAGSPV